MKTTIYYFTGTGNSRAIAAQLATRIPESTTVAISEELLREIATGTAPIPKEQVGFVFPTYAYGLPRMVREFAAVVPIGSSPYMFAVASSFGIPGAVLRQLDGILRKRKTRLNAGFTVLDPRSSLAEDPNNDPIQRTMISVNRGRSPASSSERLEEIADTVANRRRHKLETSNLITNVLGRTLNRLASPTFRETAQHFWVQDSCVGCGLCSRVCPRNNISLESGRPVWGNNCEYCHACIQWCPKAAIQFKDITEGKPRYQNSEVSATDMVLRPVDPVRSSR